MPPACGYTSNERTSFARCSLTRKVGLQQAQLDQQRPLSEECAYFRADLLRLLQSRLFLIGQSRAWWSATNEDVKRVVLDLSWMRHGIQHIVGCALRDSMRRTPTFPFSGQHSFDAQVEVQVRPRETDSQVFEFFTLFRTRSLQSRIPRKRSNNDSAVRKPDFDSQICYLSIDDLVAGSGVYGDQSRIYLTLESDFSRLLGWHFAGPLEPLVYVEADRS